MLWLWVLCIWRICSYPWVDGQGCSLRYVNKENTSETCSQCKEIDHSINDCIRATGSPHRLGQLSVVPSDALVLTLDVAHMDNRTVLEVDISEDYSASTTGYLLLFMLDNGRDLCLSVILPGCNESLGFFSLSIRGICSEDPEIHKLLDTEVVSQDWISDVIIGRANSSYLKVTFDVKSRTVKWYAVELWDRQDNLIKSEKTDKNYVIFQNIAEGTYYVVVSILEMMEDTLSPCGRDVMGKRLPGTCTAKRSRLFEYPLRKRADRDLTEGSLGGLEVSAIVGGVLLVAVLSLTLTRKYHKCLFQKKSFSTSTRSVTIIASTICFPAIKELLKILKNKLNVECNREIISKQSVVPLSKISSNIIIVVLSKEILTCVSTLFGEPEKSDGKSVVFVECDSFDYEVSILPKYPIFNIANSCDRLIEFLELTMGPQDNQYIPGKFKHLKNESIHRETSNGNRTSSFDEILKDSRYSVSPNMDSISKIIDYEKSAICTMNPNSYGAGDPEVSTVFSSRSWFLPSDRYSDLDSAYVTQSECMKQINDLYDASQRPLGTKRTPEEMEAISLGERSV